MSYGFQQFDEYGETIIDTSQIVNSLIKIDTVSITLQPGSASGSTYPSSIQYSLPGVTSQQDLDDNYIIQEIPAGFSLFDNGGSFAKAYVSAGVISFTNNSGCYTIFGDPRPCSFLDARTETYNVYVVGKAL